MGDSPGQVEGLSIGVSWKNSEKRTITKKPVIKSKYNQLLSGEVLGLKGSV